MLYRFDSFTLDLARGCLEVAGREVELRPKCFDVLRHLLENDNRLISKEALVAAVWPQVVVSDESLARCISDVRAAIADHEHKLIKTVPRRGYLFTADVSRHEHAGARPRRRDPETVTEHASTENALTRSALTGNASTERPSIAVLAFTSLSGDPDQEYFSDGITEDIITGLSRLKSLFVIARSSSFTYKGKSVDIKRVGCELGVRYVLEGSVRKAGDRVRITGQLVDAATGNHIWADRYDGTLEDVFDLQDRVTMSVIGAIAPRLERAEIARALRKPTESLNAYDYYLRGLAKLRPWTKDANGDALQLFCKAIEFDPRLASAYGMAAWCYVQRKARGWMTEHVRESAEAARLARRAVHLGGDDSVALCMGGYVLAFVAHEFDDAAVFMDRGLVVNPNSAQGWTLSAWLRVWRGEPELALAHVARAMRLSPLDPSMYGMHGAMAYAHFLATRYDLASSWAEKSMRDNPSFLLAICMSSASNAHAGRLEQAQRRLVRALECGPDLHISNLKDMTPFCRPRDLAAFAKGLRKAGLPE